MAKNRPDLFVHVLNNLRYGLAAEELSEKMAECIDASRETGKASEITLKIKIKPKKNSGQHFIEDIVSVSLPKPERMETIMFETDDGNLTREDPRQHKLNLRSVEQTHTGVKEVQQDAPAVKHM